MLSQVMLLCLSLSTVTAMRTHFVYWNSTNPIFRRPNNVLEVNRGNFPSEHDQLHLICPNSREQHVIYAVSEEEFKSCRVSSPRPKIVAVCNQPERFRYFTITFRSFSPNPTALEFKPGQSYYLVSTSTPMDLHRRAGGFCATHNMKMVINVAQNEVSAPAAVNTVVKPSTASPFVKAFSPTKYTTPSKSSPVYYYRSKTPAVHASDYIYYYSPRDLVQLKLRAKKHDKGYRAIENETYSAAQRLTSASSTTTSLSLLSLLLPVVFALWR